MRIYLRVLAVLAFSAALLGQAPEAAPPVTPNFVSGPPNPSSPADQQPVAQGTQTGKVIVPQVSAKDAADAQREFNAGVKLKSSGKLEQALAKFEDAARLDPRSVNYVTARELTRQDLVMQALERGNKAMLEQKEVLAMAEFQRALQYDPQNEFAKQRLKDSSYSAKAASRGMRIAANSEEIVLQTNARNNDFHYRGDARTLLTQMAQAYGVTAAFDDSVPARRVRFDIEDANFTAAMEAATRVTKTFWIALSQRQMYFLNDTVENRRNFERMSIRTFYLSDLVTPQELAEAANILRSVLEIRLVSQDAAESTITVRATPALVQAASQLLESMITAKPEVLLDISAYEISHSLMQQLGTALPTQFTLFNISPQLIAGLGAGGQNLINQLIASGGINQANSQAIQALLGQLQNSSSNPLISLQPFATFGGGLTLMGLSGQPSGITAKFNLNESDVRTLEHVILRATQNSAATMKIGERYPIVNATFAPIYNTAAISQVIANSSYIAPFPSFNFEDLGLVLKATPIIHSDRDVTMKLDLQFRALAGSTNNGIPIVNNREYSGTITAKNGDSSVIAGFISHADSRNLTGYPFLSRVPAVNYAFAEHDKNMNDDDLLIVITPQIVRMPNENTVAITLPVGH